MLQNTSRALRKAWSTKKHPRVEVYHIWLMAFYEFQNEKKKKKTHLTTFLVPLDVLKLTFLTVSFDCLYKRDIIMKILNE